MNRDKHINNTDVSISKEKTTRVKLNHVCLSLNRDSCPTQKHTQENDRISQYLLRINILSLPLQKSKEPQGTLQKSDFFSEIHAFEIQLTFLYPFSTLVCPERFGTFSTQIELLPPRI